MFAKIQLPQLNNSKIDITIIKFKLHPKQDIFCFQIISITLREDIEKKDTFWHTMNLLFYKVSISYYVKLQYSRGFYIIW